MLGSGIIDFAIGIVFSFLAMSLAAGAATEAIASMLKTRSQTLLQGVKDLLNDQSFQGLAKELYTDVLINPRVDGTTPPNRKTNPAYIDSDHFAAALIDAVKRMNSPAPTSNTAPANATAAGAQQHQAQQPVNPLATLRAQVVGMQDAQIKRMLLGMIDRAQGDERAVRAALSKWFDSAMDRVSGVYKRWAQAVSFGLAFAIAALLNVSTIDVAQQLWRQPVDGKVIASMEKITAQTQLPDYVTTLRQMPIGWPAKAVPATGTTTPATGTTTPSAGTSTPPASTSTPPAATPSSKQQDEFDACSNVFSAFWRNPVSWNWLRIFGWVMTAFTTLFGAPFWFDTLQQLVRLKGSGPSPAEKQQNMAASH